MSIINQGIVLVWDQVTVGEESKAFGVKKVPGWAKETKTADCRAEVIVSIGWGRGAEVRQETTCVYAGCPGGFD